MVIIQEFLYIFITNQFHWWLITNLLGFVLKCLDTFVQIGEGRGGIQQTRIPPGIRV